jgi:murein L,D-transpeptidase YcbB/YkuD
MSVLKVLGAVATAVAGTVGWSDSAVPPADPAEVQAMLAEIGIHAGPSAAGLDGAIRRFQLRSGLTADGVAGPETVHALATMAHEHRHLRELGFAA